MLQNNQMVFLFSVASLLRFVSLFLTSLSLLQRKIPIQCALWKNRGNIWFFLQISYLATNWDQLSNYFPTKAPCLRITCDGERERCQMPFTSVAYTVSDSVLSLETTFPFSDGLVINANQILIINM